MRTIFKNTITIFQTITKKDWISILLGTTYFLIQFIFNGFHGFGYFTDELYYMASASRPAAGYVDQPPLSIMILRIMISLLGDSIPVLRVLPALAGGATVFMTGVLTRKFGGSGFASALASLGVIAAPVLMVLFGFYSMNSFEVFLWVSFTLVAVIILIEDRPKLWLLAGLIIGLGLENKHTIGVYGFAFFVGLLLTSERRHLKSPWLWAGGLIAAILMLPNLVWQIQNDWPSLEFYRSADSGKNLDSSPIKVVLDQVLAQNPMSVILWLPGLFFLFRDKQMIKVRAFAWAYLVLLSMLILAKSSRPDRIAAAYPILFASGTYFLEKLNRRWIIYSAIGLMTLAAGIFAPAGLPVLPPEKLAAYATTIRVIPQIEKGKATALPMWFGNRFDWDEIFNSVNEVYESLPSTEKKNTIVYAAYYSHAGAIERFGRGKIPVISGHNTYYLWKPEGLTWTTVISVGVPKEKLTEVFAEVEQVGSYSRRFTNDVDVPIYLCRKPRIPLDEAWKNAKRYI